ncbi:transposase, partial [Xanthomonas oryzae]|uniref:transposase n=1 Tax=Xanthomonas oryzae TaxID=347 RepID=UPI00209B1BA5
MRDVDVFSEQLFTVKRLEEFIPANHPLRPVREMVNDALRRLDGLFERMYAPNDKGGRPSIAPEKLARAMLLQVFYSIRSERQLMEQVQYNLLFRWFIGLSMDDAVWVPTVFSKNRERLIEHDVVVALFNVVRATIRPNARSRVSSTLKAAPPRQPMACASATSPQNSATTTSCSNTASGLLLHTRRHTTPSTC